MGAIYRVPIYGFKIACCSNVFDSCFKIWVPRFGRLGLVVSDELFSRFVMDPYGFGKTPECKRMRPKSVELAIVFRRQRLAFFRRKLKLLSLLPLLDECARVAGVIVFRRLI